MSFGNSDTSDLLFEGNTCCGNEVKLNTSSNQIEVLAHPLVTELFNRVPEFDEISDHSSDDLLYAVYGDLSLILADQIKNSSELNELIIHSFSFFNDLGNRNNREIDNLLVVGIYEGLYSNKKCNDVGRDLLSGRSKEVYEHWMINGNIKADY